MQYAVFDPLLTHFKQSSLAPLLVTEWPESLPRAQMAVGGPGGAPKDMAQYMPIISTTIGQGNVLQVPGEYPTIQAAVDAAEENDAIMVSPGTYTERLVVTTRVLIEGVAGPQGELPILCASGNGHVVEFATVQAQTGAAAVYRVNPALLRRFVVRHKGMATHNQPYGAILVGPGGVVLEDCHINSRSGAGIYIEGSGVSCQMERCRIENCVQGGVLVNQGAQIYVNGCSVVQNGTHGVCIQRGAQAIIKESHINYNAGFGIATVDTHDRGTAATIENNDLNKNKMGPLYIDEVCIPRVKQMRNSGMITG